MNIKKLIIENFRGYHKRTEIDFKDLTVFVGKNDAGKSSILEALDIFFENSKPDTNDRSIYATGNVKIGVVFSDIPEDFLIDTKVKTSLKDEYLLNKDGYLEITKEFKTKTEITLNVLAPDDARISNLINKTRDELKEIAQTVGANLEGIDKRVSSELRLEIRKAVVGDDSQLAEQIIKLDTENEAKDVWKKIQSQLPFYALFKADRATSDKDKEIQDPMKLATKQILKQLESDLQPIRDKVKEYVTSLADKTIQKLNEMDDSIASTLETIFEETKWEKAFDIRLESDKIPLDKKGSGLRRLVLINFFRAEADRKMSEKKLPNVIYAIEEPETSQHPDWQIKLIDVLKELADLDNTQVLLTTHSPSLASMIKPEDIRFVKKNGNDVCVKSGDAADIEEIANTLGILPNIPDTIDKLKLIICVEGYTDVYFFTSIFRLFNLDIESDNRVVIIFTGGSTMEHWVRNNYLRKLGKPEFHICDKDVEKYQIFLDEVNSRGNGSVGLMTSLTETENYIHPTIIKEIYDLDEDVFDTTTNDWVLEWGTKDIPKYISTLLKSKNIPRSGESKIKNHLCGVGASRITAEYLKELRVHDECEAWVTKINAIIG